MVKVLMSASDCQCRSEKSIYKKAPSTESLQAKRKVITEGAYELGIEDRKSGPRMAAFIASGDRGIGFRIYPISIHSNFQIILFVNYLMRSAITHFYNLNCGRCLANITYFLSLYIIDTNNVRYAFGILLYNHAIGYVP